MIPSPLRAPLLLAALTAACSAPHPKSASEVLSNPSSALVITEVRVLDPVTGTASDLASVMIEGQKIVAIGAPGTMELRPDVLVLNGEGRYLAPGFYDMHAHLPGVDSALPAEFLPKALSMMLDAGITTARVARGAHSLLEVAAAQAKGTLQGPRLSIAAPPLRRDSFPPIEDAPSLFAEWRDAGFEAVKFLSGPKGIDYPAYVAAAGDAGLPWYGHLPQVGGHGQALLLCATPNQVSVEHASALTREFQLDPLGFRRSAQALGEAGVFVCPDLDFYYVGSDKVSGVELSLRLGVDRLPKSTVDEWIADRRLPNPRRAVNSDLVDTFNRLAPILRDAQVPLLLSASDSHFIVPGHSYAEEAAHMERAGYSRAEIFRMATLHGAQCLREADIRGLVQVGFVADLVLLGENPLEDISAYRTTEAVLQGGQILRR